MATVLFLGAHQDDDILLMGGGLVNHVNAGHNVYYATITDGRASGVRQILGMDIPTFVEVRNTERDNALYKIGVTALEASQGRMSDGTLNIDPNMNYDSSKGPHKPGYTGNEIAFRKVNMGIVDRIRDLLSQVADRNGIATTAVRVRTNSWQDPHPDHRALAQAILFLWDRGEILDLRMYLTPLEWNGVYIDSSGCRFMSAAQLGAVAEQPAVVTNLTDALRCYVKTNTICGRSYGTAVYGIGYLSVSSMFDQVMSAKCSMYHLPPTILNRN